MRTRLAAVAVSAVLAFPVARAEDAPSWSVQGHWWESCSCGAPCPCWKDEKPTMKDCPDMAYFHIDKGHFGKTSLDGAQIVLVGRSAEGKKMSESMAAKDFQIVNFYLPKSASKEQASALVGLVSRFLGAPPEVGKKHAVKHVQLNVKDTAEKLSLEIPDILQVELERTKEPYPIDTSMAGWSGKGDLAKQVRYDFKDDGAEWKLKDRNAMYAPLAWSSDRGPLPGEPGYKPPEPAK